MPRAKTNTAAPTARKYTRRTEEQRIADLEAKIQRIKRSAASKATKKDPTLRHVSKAVKSIDAAMEATGDAALRIALHEARTTLGACLQLQGAAVPKNGRSNGSVNPEAVLAYLQSNPGQRGGQVAGALGIDTKTLRGSMKRLIEAGKIKTKGQRRGMQYWAG